MFASFVGPGRYTTRAALAAASGIPEASLREYAGGAAMPLFVLLAIRPHLPAAAINMMTEVGGVRFVDAERNATNWDHVASAAAGLTSEICAARADGHVDHVEAVGLKRRVRDVIAELQHVAEQG